MQKCLGEPAQDVLDDSLQSLDELSALVNDAITRGEALVAVSS